MRNEACDARGRQCDDVLVTNAMTVYIALEGKLSTHNQSSIRGKKTNWKKAKRIVLSAKNVKPIVSAINAVIHIAINALHGRMLGA